MPHDDHDLTDAAARAGARIAELLSDPDLVAGVLDGADFDGVTVRPSVPRVDIAVHLNKMEAFDLDRKVDPRDPLIATRRRLTPQLRRDLEAAEGPLFAWLEEGRDRPAQFVSDPAAVVRSLRGLDAGVRERVAAYMPQSSGPIGRMSGAVVDQVTVVTSVPDFDAVTPSHDPQTKASTAADAVFEIGLDQLARVLDGEMIPEIRQRASQMGFETIVRTPTQQLTQQGVLSLLLEDAGDPRLALDADSQANTLVVTIGFPEATLTLGSGPLANPVPANLGAVEVQAKLKLSAQRRADGGGTTVSLTLVPDSLTVSTPVNLDAIPLPAGLNASLRQQLWNAAVSEALAKLAPFYGFGAPLTFDEQRCGIGAHGVTPVFRPGSATSSTVPSLALFMSLLGSSPDTPPTDQGGSLVPTGADGHLLLSNALMLELACCLTAESEVWGNLPSQPTEGPSEGNLCCRWRDIDDVSLGEERFDTLKLLEICVEDGLRMKMDLRKSGFGWRVKVEITAEAKIVLDGGRVYVDTTTQVKVTTSVALWVKIVAVVAIVVGIVVAAVGLCTGNWGLAAGGGGLAALGLGLWVLAHLLTPDIRLPTSLDDTGAILDLLPGGLRERLGVLSFLTDASWDDVALSGFMTLPNEPPLVAGADVMLAPGQGLDLDTGEVVSVTDVPLRLDVDLVLQPGFGEMEVELSTMSTARAGAGATSGGWRGRVGERFGRGRKLAAFGSTRLLGLTGRPYPSVSESDLRSVVFPATATHVTVPERGSSPDGVSARVVAARSSAGRLAKAVVWTDALGRTWLRYRTYDTQLLLTLATNHWYEQIGKPGVTDILTTLHARFQAVPAGAWAGRPGLRHEWYWNGTRVHGVATIEGDARLTVIDDRCTIDTQSGVDLRGAVCVVAHDPGGLSLTACSNVLHIGRLPKPPDVPEPGGPAGPVGGQPGGGWPGGGTGRPGSSGWPGSPGRPA